MEAQWQEAIFKADNYLGPTKTRPSGKAYVRTGRALFPGLELCLRVSP